ncbi:hypothetical protein ACLOJK_004172 [Asimina triloba]
MGRRTHRVEARREEAEKATISLRSALDAERADLEAAHDNAEGILLSKCNLDKALALAEMEADDLRLLNRDPKASVQRLTDWRPYRCRTEYEYSHHAYGGYMKALLDVHVPLIYPRMGILYGSCFGGMFGFSTGVARDGWVLYV